MLGAIVESRLYTGDLIVAANGGVQFRCGRWGDRGRLSMGTGNAEK